MRQQGLIRGGLQNALREMPKSPLLSTQKIFMLNKFIDKQFFHQQLFDK